MEPIVWIMWISGWACWTGISFWFIFWCFLLCCLHLKTDSFLKFSATEWESFLNGIPRWEEECPQSQCYSLISSIILKCRQWGICWLGVTNLFLLLQGNIYLLLRSWNGQETDTKQLVKFMSFLIVPVVSGSQRHIYSNSPNHLALWWVIPGKYVLKIVTSTSLCSKQSFFRPC